MMLAVAKETRGPGDADLVRARDHDGLVARHYDGVYAVALHMLGDPGEARDAAQETFARALAGLDTYDPSRPFAAWLLSIAANLIRDRYRRRRPDLLRPEDDAPVVLPPDARLIREEDRGRVLSALARLPFDLRIVVAMAFTEDRPYAEIAAALGVSVNAVRVRLFRALSRLRESLKEKP
jgi:RNA polymerase sigma-70 factor (ECF subfamily)